MLSVYGLALLAFVVAVAAARRGGGNLTAVFERATTDVRRLVRSAGAVRCAVAASALLAAVFFVEMFAEPVYVHPGLRSRGAYDAITLAADVVASGALALLYLALSRARTPRAVWLAPIAAAAAMYGAALFSRLVPTSDLFAYVAYAKLGALAYAPPHVPFTGAFAPLNGDIALAWNTLNPSPYGPLFLLLDRLAVARATSIVEAIVALRLLSLAAVAVCALSLRALGFGLPVLAVFALDPEIVVSYVWGAHNDILALAAVLAAMAIARRNRLAAWPLAVAAGAIKAPYAIVACLAALPEPVPARRVAFAAATIAGAVVVSLAGSRAYLTALTFHGTSYGVAKHSLASLGMHAAAVALALGAVAVAVAVRRTSFGAVWVFPALAAQSLRWYAALSIPYAVAERRHTAFYFTLYPVTAFLLDEYATHPWPIVAAFAAVVAAGLLAVATRPP
jgi:hypothetical protein